MESNNGRKGAAIKHLDLLRRDAAQTHSAYYVRLSFTYGVTVPEIANASGLTVKHVRELLGVA